MAKTPKSSMDEEEIIKRRDGVASDDLLAPEDRRALADARLRALAFALGVEQNAREEAGELSDTDLLAYLLDILSPDGRQRLEHAARGDRHILSRLMTLRSGLDARPDRRDQHRAEGLTRAIRRHIARRIEIRPAGDILQFQEKPRLGGLPEPERLAFPTAAAARFAESVPPPPAFLKGKRPQGRSDRETEARLLSALERARSHFHAGRRLIDEMEALLERPQGAGRREGSEPRDEDLSRSGSIERVRRQLRELLHQFQIIAKTTSMIIASVEATSSTGPSLLEAPLLLERDDLQAFLMPQGDHETWEDAVSVQAGPWGVNLSGTARPSPRLRVAVGEGRHESPHSEPFLALVRPRQGFEPATIDSEGRASFPLTPGESVLLVQDDEVWEIRLSLRNARGSSRLRQFLEE
jgi:hypothetical protein